MLPGAPKPTVLVIDDIAEHRRLLGDILAYSRTDLVDVQRKPVDLHALAKDVADTLAPADGSVEIRIEPPPTVLADGGMIRQVIANLLSNAIKFAGPMPSAQVLVRAEEGEDEVVIHVEDNGPGFDASRKERLFKLFSRLHSDAQFPGNGVGLATVKRLVERHGGTVDAHSSPGYGTRFTFSLPN